MRSEQDILLELKHRLEELEEEKKRILTAIAVIGGPAEIGTQKMPINVTSVSSPGEYAGMTITDAAIHFLQAEGKPAKTAEIARALKAGQISSQSKNLYRMIYNSLSHRSNTKKDVQKKGSTWVLR